MATMPQIDDLEPVTSSELAELAQMIDDLPQLASSVQTAIHDDHNGKFVILALLCPHDHALSAIRLPADVAFGLAKDLADLAVKISPAN